MQNHNDLIEYSRSLPREKRFDIWLALCCAALFALSLYMYWYSFQFEGSDLYTHANIAADFDFGDLHTITSRLAYPLWHLAVAVIYKLGVPLAWAAAVVCALCKVGSLLLVRRILRLMVGENGKPVLITLFAFALMFVTGVRIRSINIFVYKPIGSPNVWHNPTQLAVILSMLVLVPYTMHCWYLFAKQRDAGVSNPTLPWKNVLMLIVITMASLAAKPTFMQAFLPAAAIFFAFEWARDIKQWRYFLRLIVAFLPAALYFLLQYLYYTGVVVPFSSGVAIGFSARIAWETLRNVLMMSAFPLFAVICCWKKGMFKDKQLVLCLLMVLVSTAEGMLFRETGQRENHGNFLWAGMTTSLMLWVHMTGVYVRDTAAYLKSANKSVLRGVGYALALGLFVWHLASGIYYVYCIIWRGAIF